MGSASFVFWCSIARSKRSGHHSKLRRTLRELCVTAPCIGEDVSALVVEAPLCGTGHLASVDMLAPLSCYGFGCVDLAGRNTDSACAMTAAGRGACALHAESAKNKFALADPTLAESAGGRAGKVEPRHVLHLSALVADKMVMPRSGCVEAR